MMEEPAAPRIARGAALIEATREDLDLYAGGDPVNDDDMAVDETMRISTICMSAANRRWRRMTGRFLASSRAGSWRASP